MQITNKKGEKLYLVIITSSKEFNKPFVTLKTWEDSIKIFKDVTQEMDNDEWYSKIISLEIHEVDDNLHSRSASAQTIVNHKGWGSDYYKEISITPANDFYW